MSGRLGADAAQLTALGRNLKSQREPINAVVATVSNALANTYWEGPAHDQFKTEWEGAFKNALNRLCEAFDSAGQDCISRSEGLAQVMGRR